MQEPPPLFEFFDPDQPIAICRRRLPHWFQPDRTYFITFRTADSLPQDVLQRWFAERDAWLTSHSIDPSDGFQEEGLSRLSHELRARYHRRFSEQFHAALDKGCGESVLGRPQIARIVADAFHHFDGERYHLGDFVVMPNHVHLLVRFLGDIAPTRQCKSWEKFTAGKINEVLGRKGHFWQGESFDHLVRSPESFEFFRRYIADNPARAGLPEGKYLLYRRPE